VAVGVGLGVGVRLLVGVMVGVPVGRLMATTEGAVVLVAVAVGVGLPRPHPASTEAASARPTARSTPPLAKEPRPIAMPALLRRLPPRTTAGNIRHMNAQSRTVRIAPSILSADFSRLGEQLAEAEDGGADAIHVDVMDGHFVPNITLGPLVVEAVRRSTSLPLHVHLMIERPREFVRDFASAGASVLIVHQEGNWTLHRVLEEIRRAGASAGIALNPTTPVSHLEELVPFVDTVLAMTVEPGFGGQSFIPTMYNKISRLRRYLDEHDRSQVSIEVDGGVNADTIRNLVQAGADTLVAGAAVFAAQCPIAQAIASLRAAAEGRPWA